MLVRPWAAVGATGMFARLATSGQHNPGSSVLAREQRRALEEALAEPLRYQCCHARGVLALDEKDFGDTEALAWSLVLVDSVLV